MAKWLGFCAAMLAFMRVCVGRSGKLMCLAKENTRFEGLQLLRAIAATWVAGFHLSAVAQSNPSYSGVFLLFRHGEAGVDLFFVLSGFIIFYTASHKPEQGAWVFLTHRFFRVFPPYWGILMATLLLHLLYAWSVGDASLLPSFQRLAVSALLLPYPDQIINVAWTLALEVTFYCLFAASYFKFGFRGLLLALGAWAVAGRALLLLGTVPTGLSLIFHSVVVEFLYGIIIGHFVMTGRTRGRFPALLLGSALLVILPSGFSGAPMLPRELSAGLPAALVVYGMTGWKLRLPRLVLLWGDASYILYLIHLLVFSTLTRLLEPMTQVNSYGSDLSMAGLLVSAIIISCLLCSWVERPYLIWVRRHLQPA